MKDARFVEGHTTDLKREAARLARLVTLIDQTPTEGDSVLLHQAIAQAAEQAHFAAATLAAYHKDALARMARNTYR